MARLLLAQQFADALLEVADGLGEALLKVYSLLDGRTRLGELAGKVRSPEARMNLLRLTYLLVQTDLARLS